MDALAWVFLILLCSTLAFGVGVLVGEGLSDDPQREVDAK